MPDTGGPFRPVDILRILAEQGVEFVLIGGLAATIHGSPHATVDVDVVPRRDPDNLERLSRALHELGARVYGSAEEPLAFNHDGRSLGEAEVWNLATIHGGLDITFVPAGTSGYADFSARAQVHELGAVSVVVAALEDVIRSKAAAGRPKDEMVLPTLRELLASKRGPR